MDLVNTFNTNIIKNKKIRTRKEKLELEQKKSINIYIENIYISLDWN